jgi:hypothetical protein
MTDFSLTSPVPVGGRSSHDHYPTPRWCTEALLHRFFPPRFAAVLDPASGEGEILDVMRERCSTRATLGIELHPGRAAAACERGHLVSVGDGLASSWADADVVVGNPPYSLAEDFAWKAASWAAEGGYRGPAIVALLLRLSFLEPAGTRRALFRTHPPDVLILPKRPTFAGKGTDSTTSAWLLWPGEGQLVWLPP